MKIKRKNVSTDADNAEAHLMEILLSCMLFYLFLYFYLLSAALFCLLGRSYAGLRKMEEKNKKGGKSSWVFQF